MSWPWQKCKRCEKRAERDWAQQQQAVQMTVAKEPLPPPSALAIKIAEALYDLKRFEWKGVLLCDKKTGLSFRYQVVSHDPYTRGSKWLISVLLKDGLTPLELPEADLLHIEAAYTHREVRLRHLQRVKADLEEDRLYEIYVEGKEPLGA